MRFCFSLSAVGHADDADVNAARNILAAEHAILACGKAASAAFDEAGTSENR